MIHAIIIDDEQQCIETLSILLKMHCPEVVIDATCTSGQAGIDAINQYKPDVVFLDIEMPKMNGFDLLSRFDKVFFHVVFTTAYSQFAIKAFKVSALNYLLKPIDPDDMKLTVARLKQLQANTFKEQFDILLQSMQKPAVPAPRMAISTGDGMVFIDINDLIYCQSESNYTHIIMANGDKYFLSRPLKEFEDSLSGSHFFRIHNSYLVNVNQIKKFVRGDGGYVIMNDGTQITIARARREEFFSLFEKL